ncbi:MAG: RES family NAD+ phosphorylase [Candidatus Berkiella sp.]
MLCAAKISMGIFKDNNGTHYFSAVELQAWRIVEDQSKSYTRKFVDTAHEHEVLEKLIEESKPAIKYYGDEAFFRNNHYLIFTPFRYPPLKWGSRFGTRPERALLYAAKDIETAMSEKAFYKLAFLQASEGNIGGTTLLSTAFKLNVESSQYIDLCAAPFKKYEDQISAKDNYEFSQNLGKKMRNNKVECFQYKSARSKKESNNIGVFSPKALVNNASIESTFVYFNCYSTKEVVEFSARSNPRDKTIFPATDFLVDGRIPLPP